MQEYDLIFSLGFACGCSQALRAVGLQYASYPLDWTGSPSVAASVDVVVSDFAHWLDEDAMRLVDVCHGPGFGTRTYLNERTQIGFCHEFPDTQSFAESYPGVKATYERRIARLLERLRDSKRILAIYVEHAARPGLPEEDLRIQLDRLRAKCPQARVDLMYVYEDVAAKPPSIRRTMDGLIVVGADYRKLEDGKPTQYFDIPVLASLFRENLSVPRGSQSSDKARVTAEMKEVHSLRWGPDRSRLRRWLNQRAYKLYRSLEKYLQKRDLIHREQPVWFWEEE